MGKTKRSKNSGKCLQKLFSNNLEKLNRYKSEKKDAISFLKDSFHGNFPPINKIPITEAKIKGIISSLKPKKLSRL